MREVIGAIFKVLGGIVGVGFALWASFLILRLLVHLWGFGAGILGFLFLPITDGAIAIIAGLAYSFWVPAILLVISSVGFAILFIGSFITGDKRRGLCTGRKYFS